MTKIHYLFFLAASLFSSYFLLDGADNSNSIVFEKSGSGSKVYEMRTYTTHEGKLDALHQRFSNHTMRLFEKHGMINIGYWVPEDPELAQNTLIYIVSHESREAAERNWESFRADPEWQEVYEASHADGIIVKEVQSVFMYDTPYSPMKISD